MNKCIIDLNKCDYRNDIINQLKTLIKGKQFTKIVILCIGTDRSTGDSFGPLVGLMLKDLEVYRNNIEIIGTIHNPVHAKNLDEVVTSIDKENTFIIAVDACLGRSENVGKLIISDEPINPGAALNKGLPPIGDISIAGVVNIAGSLDFMVLQNTRLSLVYSLAQVVSESLIDYFGLNSEKQKIC